jgi:DNA-directed RNA polymerase specialized sigma24 family protein
MRVEEELPQSDIAEDPPSSATFRKGGRVSLADEQELIAGIADPDKKIAERSFEKAWEIYYEWLVGYGIRRHQLSDDDAQAVASETLEAFWKKVNTGTYCHTAKIVTLLVTIFEGRRIDHFRRNTSGKGKVLGTAVPIEELDITSGNSERFNAMLVRDGALRLDLNDAIRYGGLSREELLAFDDHYLKGKTFDQMAKERGWSGARQPL